MKYLGRNFAFGYAPGLHPDHAVTRSAFIGIGHDPLVWNDATPRYRLTVRVDWSWLPHIVWFQEGWDESMFHIPVPRRGIASSAWTGRTLTVHNWRWPFKVTVRRSDD